MGDGHDVTEYANDLDFENGIPVLIIHPEQARRHSLRHGDYVDGCHIYVQEGIE